MKIVQSIIKPILAVTTSSINSLIRVLEDNRQRVERGLSDGTRALTVDSVTANTFYGSSYLLDAGTAFYLSFLSNSTTAFTADRTLTYDLDNASRVLKITGNPTIADWFDQSVKTTAGPTFDHLHVTNDVAAATVTTPQIYVDHINEKTGSHGVWASNIKFDGYTIYANPDALISVPLNLQPKGSEYVVALGEGLKTDVIAEKTAAAGVTIDGALIKDGAFEGAVESKCVDVVHFYELGIATNDTVALTFDFVPSKIVIHWSGLCEKSTSKEPGQGVGSTVITITGTDTHTSIMSCDILRWNAQAAKNVVDYTGGNTGGPFYVSAGVDAAGSTGWFGSTGAWVTSTKTYTATFNANTTNDATSYITGTATAYK